METLKVVLSGLGMMLALALVWGLLSWLAVTLGIPVADAVRDNPG